MRKLKPPLSLLIPVDPSCDVAMMKFLQCSQNLKNKPRKDTSCVAGLMKFLQHNQNPKIKLSSKFQLISFTRKKK